MTASSMVIERKTDPYYSFTFLHVLFINAHIVFFVCSILFLTTSWSLMDDEFSLFCYLILEMRWLIHHDLRYNYYNDIKRYQINENDFTYIPKNRPAISSFCYHEDWDRKPSQDPTRPAAP